MLWIVGICAKCGTTVAFNSKQGLNVVRNNKDFYCTNCYLGTLDYITISTADNLNNTALELKAKLLTKIQYN